MTNTLIEIDGVNGGGQLLRTALCLSVATGRGFHITNIRGKRPVPGLKRQHLTGVLEGAALCEADVSGAEMKSKELTFMPRRPNLGSQTFDVGSGGSILLVLQAVAAAAARMGKAGKSTTLTIKGGTYCPMAPTFEFAQRSLLPCLKAMGYPVELKLVKPAFYQTGGGEVDLVIDGAFSPKTFEMTKVPTIGLVTAEIINNRLSPDIADREGDVLEKSALLLAKDGRSPIRVINDADIEGPGNAVILSVQADTGTTDFSEIGVPRMRAETVAGNVVKAAEIFIKRKVPVDVRLADQLLVPMALAAGGTFLTSALSAHSRTCIEVIHRFAPGAVKTQQTADGMLVTVKAIK